MCGIVGILAFKSSIPNVALERATSALAHRGPDDSGTIMVRATQPELELGLGHRRLSILDLSPQGHQPMQDSLSGNWIVYNGEIYNFRELRDELEKVGVNFKSQSDTEVILAAYRLWGDSFLSRLEGMFAFAIWDAQKKQLFLARDRLGIKPLYFYQSDEFFIFASEVRSLLSTGLITRHVDATGILSYLEFGSVCEPWTLVENIRSLPAAHWAVVKKGSAEFREYWRPSPPLAEVAPKLSTPGEVSATKTLSTILHHAVLSHMVSDVPVGVFLSGGIDSSALVALLSRSGLRPSTFSLVFAEQEFNEAQYSRQVARLFRTDHHEISVSQQDALNALPGALSAMDQPTIDGVNTYIVSQKAREAGVKVALTGTGADEMFAGYSNFHRVPKMERFIKQFDRLPAFVRRTVVAAAKSFGGSDRNRKLTQLASVNGKISHPYFLVRALFSVDERRSLFTTSSAEAAGESLTRLQQDAVADCDSLDAVNRVSYLESKFYMRNTLLRDSDFMSMAHGLELRVPFLDRALVEACFRVPGTDKLKGNSTKSLLLKSLGVELPRQIVNRPKRGFTLPFERWLRGEMRPLLENVLLKGDWDALGINPVAVRQIWAQFLEHETSWSRPWSLFTLHRWYEHNF